MSVTPTAAAASTSAQKRTDPSDDRLQKACHEMEGYFVGMLLKKMHESAMKGGLFEEKSESATYRDMFDDAVASEIGKNGSFGIADMLYRELSKRLDLGQDAAVASPGPLPLAEHQVADTHGREGNKR